MKILQITSHLDIGGISRYVLSLSKKLVERGHQVILASEGGGLQTQARANGLVHWFVPFHTSTEFSPKVFWGIRRLLERLRHEPVDVIHAHTRVAQVAADQISQRFGIPYVTTWHGVYKRRLGRRLWPCTGEITIAISQFVHHYLVKDFKVAQEKIRCIYNGIDTVYYMTQPDPKTLQAYRQHWNIVQDQAVIGGVGRLAGGGVKGFDLLLQAARLLKRSVPDLGVLIVGEGPRRPYLENLVRHLGIQDHVIFVGETDDIRVPLALMDVFVFTSRWPEAFGLTLVEAMAAGKAVVATKVGAVPEIVQHGISGWIVPPEDPPRLAESILLLLKDRDTASRLAHQAQRSACEMFNLERFTNEVEQVYQQVVHQESSKSVNR